MYKLKFDEQLSRLQKPQESEMTPAQFEAYEKATQSQMENWGFINNLFKVLPLNASQYDGFLQLKASLFNESCYLSDLDKEMIGVVVSCANSCNYCLTSHGDFLRGHMLKAGMDPQLVDRLQYNFRGCKDDLTPKQYALCEYAWNTTLYPREIDGSAVEGLRAAGFNDHEILEAAYVTGFFNYTNRWISTIGPIANKGHYLHNRGIDEAAVQEALKKNTKEG